MLAETNLWLVNRELKKKYRGNLTDQKTFCSQIPSTFKRKECTVVFANPVIHKSINGILEFDSRRIKPKTIKGGIYSFPA